MIASCGAARSLSVGAREIKPPPLPPRTSRRNARRERARIFAFDLRRTLYCLRARAIRLALVFRVFRSKAFEAAAAFVARRLEAANGVAI